MPATQWEPRGEEKKGRLTRRSPHPGPHVAAAALRAHPGTNPPEGRAGDFPESQTLSLQTRMVHRL